MAMMVLKETGVKREILVREEIRVPMDHLEMPAGKVMLENLVSMVML